MGSPRFGISGLQIRWNGVFDAIVVCDLSGRTLLKATGDAVGEFSVTLPASFAKGCYIVKLMRNNAVVKYGKLMVR